MKSLWSKSRFKQWQGARKMYWGHMEGEEGRGDNAQSLENQHGLLCVGVVLGEPVGSGWIKGFSGHGGMMSVGSCLGLGGRNGDLCPQVMEVQVNPGVGC